MKEKITDRQHRLVNQSSVILVSSSFKNLDNIMAVAWHQVIDVNPVLLGISIGIKRFTHDLIEKSGYFGINVPTIDIVDKVWICGKKSGKELDKFKACKFAKLTDNELPVALIEECVGNLECEVVFKKTFEFHTLFVGEVKGAYAEQGTIKNGLWNVEEKNLVFPFHLGGDSVVSNRPKIKEVKFEV